MVLGGWMSFAFFLVGAPMSVIFGVLSDQVNRKVRRSTVDIAVGRSWHLSQELFITLIGLSVAANLITALSWTVRDVATVYVSTLYEELPWLQISQLLLFRVLLGIAAGGASPVVFSIVADLYDTAGGVSEITLFLTRFDLLMQIGLRWLPMWA
jgi:MFS family permease